MLLCDLPFHACVDYLHYRSNATLLNDCHATVMIFRDKRQSCKCQHWDIHVHAMFLERLQNCSNALVRCNYLCVFIVVTSELHQRPTAPKLNLLAGFVPHHNIGDSLNTSLLYKRLSVVKIAGVAPQS